MAPNYADVVFARLNHESLTALVEDRITPSKPPQEPTVPYVCFWRDASDHGLKLDGAETHSWITFRVESVAATQAAAEAILMAVYNRPHGWADRSAGVQVCAAQGDATEQTLEDGREVSGQGFRMRFKPT